MNSYRLVVRQADRLVAHVETTGTQAREDIQAIRALLHTVGEYQCQLLVSDSEKRILESGPEGLKIIHREKYFRPANV